MDKEKLYLKSFSFHEYQLHLNKLQREMENQDLDMLLLSSPENIFYGSGYRSWYLSSLFRPVFLAVPREGEPAIILRYLEKTTVQNSSWIENIYCSGSRDYGVMNCSNYIDGIKKFLSSLNWKVKTIGIEGSSGQHFQWSLTLLKEIIDEFNTIQFLDGTAAIQASRMVKTEWEIKNIETAGYITEKAIRDTFRDVLPGRTTEKEIASGIASKMCAGGIDKISYLTVNSGTDKYSTFNSHATSRIVQPGEIVLVDISGHYEGYASDLTRTMYLGKSLPDDYEAMAQVAMDCVQAGFKKMQTGKVIGDISQAIENYILNSPYADTLVHSSGHSIGLSVVEYPSIENDSQTPLQPGMVLALENGVYPYDRTQGAESIYISFRMEDEVLYEKTGPRWVSGPGKMIYSLENFIT
ncbi:MAG: aminopeptidase P family protein [Chloroflexi bacterium]|jgi:Xaa-Pro aminopeptidase|nr:aminopeptidase P family protein [Chloroflexota bacterium]